MKADQKIIIAVTLAVVIGVGLVWYTKPHSYWAQSDNKTQNILAKQTAPNFKLNDFYGKPHDLESFKGQVVLLHFWASWCPPCLPELPQWVELAKRLSSKKVKLVTVSIDRTWKEAQRVLPSRNLPENFVSLIDTEGEIPEIFGTFQFPETYLISSSLKIITKWIGPQEWSAPAIIQEIEKAAAETTAP